MPPPQSTPVHVGAGHAKDDPDFEIYFEEIQRFRQEVDERECSGSSWNMESCKRLTKKPLGGLVQKLYKLTPKGREYIGRWPIH